MIITCTHTHTIISFPNFSISTFRLLLDDIETSHTATATTFTASGHHPNVSQQVDREPLVSFFVTKQTKNIECFISREIQRKWMFLFRWRNSFFLSWNTLHPIKSRFFPMLPIIIYQQQQARNRGVLWKHFRLDARALDDSFRFLCGDTWRKERAHFPYPAHENKS